MPTTKSSNLHGFDSPLRSMASPNAHEIDMYGNTIKTVRNSTSMADKQQAFTGLALKATKKLGQQRYNKIIKENRSKSSLAFGDVPNGGADSDGSDHVGNFTNSSLPMIAAPQTLGRSNRKNRRASEASRLSLNESLPGIREDSQAVWLPDELSPDHKRNRRLESVIEKLKKRVDGKP